jgi:polyisoprenoid-binding protein YceI
VTGQLTLHGVTREIVVPVDVRFSESALVATGEFQLNRRDYVTTTDHDRLVTSAAP